MGRKISAFLLIIVFYFVLSGNAILVTWDKNREPDVAGYNLYIGTKSGIYTDSVLAITDTFYVYNVPDKGVDYFFAVTAYDWSGNESKLSEEASVTSKKKLLIKLEGK